MKISIHWFRRDLRLEDNVALYHALSSGSHVLPIFIFDDKIVGELPKNDARISFIHELIIKLNTALNKQNCAVKVLKGNPLLVWKKLVETYDIDTVYANKDYEPYAISRDKEVEDFLATNNIKFLSFKDQVIYEEGEILKKDGTPYTVYTPYSKKWLEAFRASGVPNYKIDALLNNFYESEEKNVPSLKELGFEKSNISVPNFDLNKELISSYHENRDVPSKKGTSGLSPHLRFGSVSVRKIAAYSSNLNETFLKELIWREFFMQILFHFPKVINTSFKEKYERVAWKNNKELFGKWKAGQTGYPIVDAGMKELNTTGLMHNRVRMVVAGFLCKHLLIDWRWGEAYFAEKLLDFELSSNNGNWQWAAGCGCDAAPYFRVFNPMTQQEKFDPKLRYVKKWIPKFGTNSYPKPIVEHKTARELAIKVYKESIQ